MWEAFVIIGLWISVTGSSSSSSTTPPWITDRNAYHALHEARIQAVEEQTQTRVNLVLTDLVGKRRLCEVGTTLVSFDWMAEATETRLHNTVRWARASGWNVSLILVGVTGQSRGDKLWKSTAVYGSDIHVEAQCLRSSHYDEMDGLSYRCRARGNGTCHTTGGECDVSNIPVLRITLPPEAEGEPGQYQRHCRDFRLAEQMRVQAESDQFLARFFEHARVLPHGETYISLLQWPSPRVNIEASVAAMAALGGWNISLQQLVVSDKSRGDGISLCTHNNAPAGSLFLTYVNGIGRIRHSSGFNYYSYEEPVKDLFWEELLYECHDRYDALLRLNGIQVVGRNEEPERTIDVILVSQ